MGGRRHFRVFSSGNPCRIFMALMFSCCASSALAVDDNSGKSVGDVVILPGFSMGTAAAVPGSLHYPGQEYFSGTGWWTLSCNTVCELMKVALTARPKLHPAYDSSPVPGQLLTFSPVPGADAILFFKPLRIEAAALRLQEGVVTTFHPGKDSRLRSSNSTAGTMEAEMTLPGGEFLRLVPVLQLSGEEKAAAAAAANEEPPLVLELRLGKRRQVLAGFDYVALEGPVAVSPKSYLRWSGDLDRDGKPDLLLSVAGGSAKLLLYLSSLAKEGEIVGSAGIFTYYPIDSAGC